MAPMTSTSVSNRPMAAPVALLWLLVSHRTARPRR
jgi:hypothetical protein